MPTIRKEQLVTGETYHIYTRSIAGFEIFRKPETFNRFIETLTYYNHASSRPKISSYLMLTPEARQTVDGSLTKQPIVQLIAYCVMPTHFHLALKQLATASISCYINNVLNSFTRYFNTAHNRKGPLWESRFKNVLIENDEQLLHLTRYIHLNPSSAGLVAKPEEWPYSSYAEYLATYTDKGLCDWESVLEIQPTPYRSFVNSRIQYQRSLSRIKSLLIDNYTG